MALSLIRFFFNVSGKGGREGGGTGEEHAIRKAGTREGVRKRKL